MLVLDSSIESGFTCLLSCSVFISQSKNPAFYAESLAKTLLGMNSPDNILLEKAAPVPPGTPADCRPPPQGPPTRPSSFLLCSLAVCTNRQTSLLCAAGGLPSALQMEQRSRGSRSWTPGVCSPPPSPCADLLSSSAGPLPSWSRPIALPRALR